MRMRMCIIAAKGVHMKDLQRVNLLLERRQREELERLATEKKRSVSDLVREYIAVGLSEENKKQRARALALKNARSLTAEVKSQRKGKPLPKTTKLMQQIRQERTNELLGHRR
jgi:hypothetical protein